MIGLLSATGIRIGEAIALTRSDIDWAEGVLTVRGSKFGKSREVPLHQTTVDAMAAYVESSSRYVSRPASTFFTSSKSTPVIYTDFATKFRQLQIRPASEPSRRLAHVYTTFGTPLP